MAARTRTSKHTERVLPGKDASPFTPSEFPADGGLTELYAELMAYPNVLGCYVGRKLTQGRAASERAVVCCVAEKVAARGLAKAERVPRRVRWPRTRTTHFDLATDVQVAEPGTLHAAPVAGPGDELEPSAAAASLRATIGVALRHPTLGRVVTTAGHAFMRDEPGTRQFGATAPLLTIANMGLGASAGRFAAIPLKAARVPEADYALLQPQGESRNLFRDALSVSGVHFARPEDEGAALFALTRQGARPTALRGVLGTLRMGTVQMRGLLFTDGVTAPGDSGCCLVDPGFRVWGLLVGAALIQGKVHSVFASANWVLALENAQLA